MRHHNTLINGNVDVLGQGIELIDRLDDEMYSLVVPPLFSSGVGSHFRHCLDAYQCLFRGLQTGKVDYDQRERDELVERDRDYAIGRLRSIIDQLKQLSNGESLMSISIRQDSEAWTYSSIGRELQSLLHHTIHHYAMIATILRLQGFSPAESFGVAPSTLEYRKEKIVYA